MVICNESKHDIILPAKSAIAEVHALQEVVQNKHRTSNTAQQGSSPKSAEDVKLNLNFDGSPLPAECRERTKGKLRAMSEVFALQDSDFGRTDKVKHQIKLSNETPFKHRS